LQFDNSRSPFASLGAEVGLRRDWRQGWMVGGWYSYTHTSFLADGDIGTLLSLDADPTVRNVSNAPEHGGALTGAIPLGSPDLLLSSRFTLEAPRYDRFEGIGDPPQRRTGGAVLWDLVLTGTASRFALDYSFGIYNAFDWRYSHPVSAEFLQRTVPQSGRTFLANATLRL
jgi:hypothetical protein